MKNSKQTWPQVQETARLFDRLIREKWPRYYEEIKGMSVYLAGWLADTDATAAGIADGAQRDILDIIALNVRTEIAFGQFSDGCTSLYWRDERYAFLGQNWDVSITHACCFIFFFFF